MHVVSNPSVLINLQMFETHYELQKVLPVGVDDSKRVEVALRWLEKNSDWLLVIEDATQDSLKLVQSIVNRGNGRTLITSVAKDVFIKTKETLRLCLGGFKNAEDCKCYWKRMKVCLCICLHTT